MRRLLVPAFACLALSGCALPLMQVAATQMTKPPAKECSFGTACPDGLNGTMGIGTISGLSNSMFGGPGTALHTLAASVTTERTDAR